MSKVSVTKVPAKQDSQMLLEERSRRGAIVYNDGSTAMLVRFGDEPCGPGDFSLRVPSKASIGPLDVSYDGPATCCWEPGPGTPPAKPTGFARVTELLI